MVERDPEPALRIADLVDSAKIIGISTSAQMVGDTLLLEPAQLREMARQAIVDNILAFGGYTAIEDAEKASREAGEPVMVVRLEGCGGHAEYWTFAAIPWEDVPCPCGNPNHWLIRYAEEDTRMSRKVTCPECDGKGFIEYEYGVIMVKCAMCDGSKFIEDEHRSSQPNSPADNGDHQPARSPTTRKSKRSTKRKARAKVSA